MPNRNSRRGRPTGQPKTGGRKAGTPNKATERGREFFQALVEDAGYQRRFRKAWSTRSLPPQLEAMVWHYAYGKPIQMTDAAATGPSLAELIAGSFSPKYEHLNRLNALPADAVAEECRQEHRGRCATVMEHAERMAGVFGMSDAEAGQRHEDQRFRIITGVPQPDRP